LEIGVAVFARKNHSAPATSVMVVMVVLFLILFVGIRYVVGILVYSISGWARLAERFAAGGEPTGKRFFMQYGVVGTVIYGCNLTIHTAPNGFYLSVWLPFRIGNPPLFIPWQEVRNATTYPFWWFEMVEFDVGSPSIATLELPKRIFEGHHFVD
jgi:hypothetical protein